MRASQHHGAGRNQGMLVLRPPGALEEVDFDSLCTRCNECAKACPHDAITRVPERMGDRSGTPTIEPARAACMMCEDWPCIEACEPGALVLDAAVALGTAQVRPLDCLNRMGSSCSVCVEQCPVPDAMRMVDGLPTVEAGLCTGCGVCTHSCPSPSAAIMILPNRDRPTLEILAALATTGEPTAEEEGIQEESVMETMEDDGRRAKDKTRRLE